MGRDEYVDRVTRWVIDRYPELAEDARTTPTLDGLYDGNSARIRRLVLRAYLRGVRRGAGLAWEARQPLSLRADRDFGSLAASFSPEDAGEEGRA